MGIEELKRNESKMKDWAATRDVYWNIGVVVGIFWTVVQEHGGHVTLTADSMLNDWEWYHFTIGLSDLHCASLAQVFANCQASLLKHFSLAFSYMVLLFGDSV